MVKIALSVVALAAVLFAQAPGDQERKSTYILGPDDQIGIRVLDLEEFAEGASGKERSYRIDLRGQINLPLIGRMKVAGQTVEQVEATLADRLKEYLKNPSVTVMVAEYKSQPISVIGQVQTPGVHQLQGRKNLLEVISVVGGLKPEAGHQIKITRKIEFGAIPLPTAKLDSTGQYSVAEVSVKRIMNAQSPEENIQIQPFDVISVPKAELVYVVGNVKRSGGIVPWETCMEMQEDEFHQNIQVRGSHCGLGMNSSVLHIIEDRLKYSMNNWTHFKPQGILKSKLLYPSL